MGGSTLPVGMVWNYIGGIGIELDRCSHKDVASAPPTACPDGQKCVVFLQKSINVKYYLDGR